MTKNPIPHLPPTTYHILGIDLGGTNVKAGIVTTAGKLIASKSIPTEGAKGASYVINKIAGVVETLLKENGLNKGNFLCCGIGVPGPLNLNRTLIYRAINLQGWTNVPLKKLLEKKLRLPVVVENDANVAAYGEKWVGAGRNVRSLVLYTLGTGIGGGIILDGELWLGSNGAAGELGHTTLEPNGRLCGCGNRGCLEAYSSATAITKMFRERTRKRATVRPVRNFSSGKCDANLGKKPTIEGISNGVKDICLNARRGNRQASEVINTAAKYLGIAIANVVHTLHPELIILSGGVAQAEGLIIQPALAEARRRVFKHLAKDIKIVKGKLGEDAGIIGAAGWAMRQMQIL